MSGISGFLREVLRAARFSASKKSKKRGATFSNPRTCSGSIINEWTTNDVLFFVSDRQHLKFVTLLRRCCLAIRVGGERLLS